MIFLELRGELKGDSEQFNGREGKTATLLSTGLFTLSLCGGGFAPRQLNRWAFRGKFQADFYKQNEENMPISFEEYEEQLNLCYDYQEKMKSAISVEEFNELRQKLTDTSSDLCSSTGEFTPTENSSRQDKEYLEEMLERRRRLKAEAETLRKWAVTSSFENTR